MCHCLLLPVALLLSFFLSTDATAAAPPHSLLRSAVSRAPWVPGKRVRDERGNEFQAEVVLSYVDTSSKRKNKRAAAKRQAQVVDAAQKLFKLRLSRRGRKFTELRSLQSLANAGVPRNQGTLLIRIENPKSVATVLNKKRDAKRKLAGGMLVTSASMNFVLKTLAAPSDPLFPKQSNLNAIRLADMWDHYGTFGNRGTKIAVVDTGIRYDNPDIESSLWYNAGEDLNGIDDDGNGVVDDVIGFDFVTAVEGCVDDDCDGAPDMYPEDRHGHGTAVAGIAGAAADNGIGISGVCSGCSLMSIRAGYRNPDGGAEFLLSDVVAAVDYAVAARADVINMSFGAPLPDADTSLREAIARATGLGIYVVAAAGNGGTAEPFYPAIYENVISVTAADTRSAPYTLAGFSTYGDWVTIAAPGVDILAPGYEEEGVGGTSMAAPHVSGLVGLIVSALQQLPKPDHGALKEALRATGQNMPATSTLLINAFEAYRHFVGSDPVPTATPASAEPTPTPAATRTRIPLPIPPGATPTRTVAPTPTSPPGIPLPTRTGTPTVASPGPTATRTAVPVPPTAPPPRPTATPTRSPAPVPPTVAPPQATATPSRTAVAATPTPRVAVPQELQPIKDFLDREFASGNGLATFGYSGGSYGTPCTGDGVQRCTRFDGWAQSAKVPCPSGYSNTSYVCHEQRRNIAELGGPNVCMTYVYNKTQYVSWARAGYYGAQPALVTKIAACTTGLCSSQYANQWKFGGEKYVCSKTAQPGNCAVFESAVGASIFDWALVGTSFCS